ncbi:MAG: hypothetical protein LBR70_04405 [Lactobacillaceae bacterium]|jgi:uncharacterized membrane protein YciS (DUF1049 family)|nr:hypothetical protein [Lactobacillaceae bacterium]
MAEIEDTGLKPLLIFVSILCAVIMVAILMVEIDQEQMDEIMAAKETSFSFTKMFAYAKYYLSRLIGFLFGID